ncbi:MAG: SpoIIE family protein phosphatase [Flammeovirgaceae bacterium]|nr:SpoIIE family protein phosphatase [Flammeovirgaceae bacterium]
MITNPSISKKGFEDLLINAINKSNEGITISSIDQPDSPLIFVNDGFERLTGYTKEDVIGKNCRFLQGKETDHAAVDVLRHAISNKQQTTVELLNYKKDGTPFWNRLSITPLKNESGITTHYVGVQSDITEIRETQKELTEANNILALFKDKINFDLYQARIAQSFIMPSILPIDERVRFSSLFEPKEQIGGDFYDVIELDKGIYGILIADVTGHGIPAALLTFMTSFAFQSSALKFYSPAKVVTATNEKLFNKMPRGSFITMFYAIYDSNNKNLTYTQAGHPEAFILRPSSMELLPLTTQGSPVGVLKITLVNYSESKIQLEVGDKFLLYTDAILEVRNEADVMMSNAMLTSFLIKNAHSSIDELLTRVKMFGLSYSGKKTFGDDFTMVGFEVLA